MSDSVGPETLQDRLDRLQELTEFTEKCKKQLNEIFETLGWSQEYDKDSHQEPMEQCPYDPDHMVPVRTMEKHKASCSLSKMGYPAEEQEEMYDPSVCYENTSVKGFLMDKSTQHQVILQARSAAPLMKMEGVFWQGQYSGQPVDVPQNHKRAVCDLTVADRLALYDHVVDVLGQQNEAVSSKEDLYVDLVSKLQKGEEQNEPKSHLELMAEMRDYKRRRQSYRAKNVHITKKSYTEVIREVISVHSEELARQWKEEEDEKQSSRSDHSPQGRWLDKRRSKSSESHHSHSKRHHGRERSHDKERKKKKKRKERDSRSPDGHHHDRKKKKKKKDDREREK
ncbi:U11/U12 small nuclear ribonucleoprotein 48 kDa protein [Girardinichthys multiradiatus]|uniref:U11/U12 small nuclear ribonucleoprotein 48 kDa protein n=1 Tax=Girardinichthys multiradiatus TaxID=208333 RepID=UPI001FAC0B86|nr:U11/U12 small nuclear ribonucleoprotein 48 kDa protein [Girardinichthys multiradiatus]